MVAWDVKIFFALNNLAGVSRLSDFFILFFADYLTYVLVVLFFISLLLMKFSQQKKLIILYTAAISTVISRGIITTAIRFFYHHPRPFDIYSVHQLIPESGYSFPSGHATFFFALAMMIYLYHKGWGYVFFLLSILVGIARVAAGVHYPSDIIGGACIGILTSYIIFHLIPNQYRT